jgi:hypothetical protein
VLGQALPFAHLLGFVAVQLNAETLIGEIGLKAVDPTRAGNGIGSGAQGLSESGLLGWRFPAAGMCRTL